MTYKPVGKDPDGNTEYLEQHVAEWYLLWKAQWERRYPQWPIIILQGKGSYKKSGRTHLDGHSIDLRTWHLPERGKQLLVADLRDHGCCAWIRRPPAFDEHLHGCVIDAYGTHTATYQVEACIAGYDGLGKNGRGGRDPHRRPAKWISYQTALNNMKKGIDDDMITDTDINRIATAVWAATFGPRKAGDLQQDASSLDSEELAQIATATWAATFGNVNAGQLLRDGAELDAGELSQIATAVWAATFANVKAGDIFQSLAGDVKALRVELAELARKVGDAE